MPTRPQTDTVYYLLDTTSAEASWITVNDSRLDVAHDCQLDEWTAKYFPDGGEEMFVNPWLGGWFRTQYPALRTPAPMTAQPATTVEVLEDATTPEGRHLRLHLAAPPEVLTTQVIVSGTNPFTAIAINGAPLGMGARQRAEFQLDLFGRHDEGVTLDLWAPTGVVALSYKIEWPGCRRWRWPD